MSDFGADTCDFHSDYASDFCDFPGGSGSDFGGDPHQEKRTPETPPRPHRQRRGQPHRQGRAQGRTRYKAAPINSGINKAHSARGAAAI